ncbi:response regulator transcription factor [Alicyclobacillus fastidiosus]|uniref:Response regulator transcription factor n=1 Tax=Alicyclobacillus fastidiosus TaxID=392011 RepID=A0ABY6ZK19_9BACL|nr:response regulator transcription factor [Alicyclobacillus fastidiosus]WAH43224.1 response regulator transcription factor [Alicyclobacillus fastidiosus]
MAVLLVEDEPGLVEFLTLELELQELIVNVATDGQTALELARTNPYDLVLLDVNLPDMSGFDVCKGIRELTAVPIIMLTARGEVADRVQGLDAGADDYLVKPFAIEELFARIRALRRRQSAPSNSEPTIYFGEVMVHLDTHRVTYQSQEVELTAREYDLLLYLLRHPNETWSRQTLLERVWGFHAVGDTNVVDVYIGYLRQKVDPDKAFIKTVRGQGYRFEVRA